MVTVRSAIGSIQARWGEGLASAALTEFYGSKQRGRCSPVWPSKTPGSAKVLTRAGFTHVGVETLFANGVGRDVVEHIYQLAR
jgi:hypothetical protein